MTILRALRALVWLATTSPTVPESEHSGIRFTSYTPTAPAASESELLS